MSALWQALGVVLTYTTILALALLALTEVIGARVPGFVTISEATREDVQNGDYRLFIAVLALYALSAIWWAFHILKHDLTG